MRTLIATLLLLCSASLASAHSCPDFFRFVDFGLEARDGALYRGGVILRAESLGGSPLLQRGRTVCAEVNEIAKDGHGNPIPVVSRIHYDPARAQIGLSTLSVAKLEDTKAAAEKAAAAHRAALGQPDTTETRGESFLCATRANHVSCQIVSPYPIDAPLVITCDASSCVMAVMAMSTVLAVEAVWPSAPSYLEDPAATGAQITQTVSRIQGFLAPLTSGL